LPSLNDSLEFLNCAHNDLDYIPRLPNSVKIAVFHSNSEQLHEVFGKNYEGEGIELFKKKVNIINSFRNTFYLSKYKDKMISWKIKSKEKKIQEQYHYKHLWKFLEENDLLESYDNDMLDVFLSTTFADIY
jgi:hypothetical protein